MTTPQQPQSRPLSTDEKWIKLVMVPNAVYVAAQHAMRVTMLDRYVGDLRELREAPRFDEVLVRSFNVQGVSTAVARRMLNNCAIHRSFIELRRVSGVRVWKAAPWLYEHLRLEALQHWQAVGYVVGQRVPEIKVADGAVAASAALAMSLAVESAVKACRIPAPMLKGGAE